MSQCRSILEIFIGYQFIETISPCMIHGGKPPGRRLAQSTLHVGRRSTAGNGHSCTTLRRQTPHYHRLLHVFVLTRSDGATVLSSGGSGVPGRTYTCTYRYAFTDRRKNYRNAHSFQSKGRFDRKSASHVPSPWPRKQITKLCRGLPCIIALVTG